MSLNDKSKKELVDIAKQLKLKTNSKMDKKVLIDLIEKHNKENQNKHTIEKEIQQKEILETILHPKEERVTAQDLKDIQEARSEMKEQSADETLEQLVIENEHTVQNDNKNEEKKVKASIKVSNENLETNNEQKTFKSVKNDDFAFSEGYTGKSSYSML